MSEIERLAQICAEAHDYPLHEDAIPIVRAILQAMREPSEGMLTCEPQIAMASKYNHGIGWQWTQYPNAAAEGYVPGRIWRAMIDHLLAEPESLGHHGLAPAPEVKR